MGELDIYAFRRSVNGKDKYIVAECTPKGIIKETPYSIGEKDQMVHLIRAVEDLSRKGYDIKYENLPKELPDIRSVDGSTEFNDTLLKKEQTRVEYLIKHLKEMPEWKEHDKTAYAFRRDNDYFLLVSHPISDEEIMFSSFKKLCLEAEKRNTIGYSIRYRTLPEDINDRAKLLSEEDQTKLKKFFGYMKRATKIPTLVPAPEVDRDLESLLHTSQLTELEEFA